MPNRLSNPKRPRDPNQLGKLITEIATDRIEAESTDAGKDPAAVALGRKGGMKGGKARAHKLTQEQRADIARIAAHARWHKKDR